MDTVEKSRVVAGVAFLVASKEYGLRVRQIHRLVGEWHHTPLLFAGELTPLNALVELGVANKDVLDKVLTLAKTRRSAIPAAKRVDYQRALMREKRSRLNRAAALEERARGTPLRGDARKEFLRHIQVQWTQERDAFIRAKGPLTWTQKNKCIKDFWEILDRRLATA